MATTDATTPFFMTEEAQALAKTTAEEILRSGGADSISPAVRDFVTMLNLLARGEAVSAFPLRSELSLTEAAKFLGASEAYVHKLLQNDEIPFRKTEERIFIAPDDLLRFKREKKRKREAVLNELSREAQEMGLYD